MNYKIVKRIILAAAFCFSTLAGYSQTNTPSPSSGIPGITGMFANLFNGVGAISNYAAVAGYGQSDTGNKRLAFADVVLNITPNTNMIGAGLVIGGDCLWGNGHQSWNTVKGGVTIDGKFRPLLWTGFSWATNITAEMYGSELIAQPHGGSPIGNLLIAGINFDVLQINKKMELDAGLAYENRSGQGEWDGNYGLVHIGVSTPWPGK